MGAYEYNNMPQSTSRDAGEGERWEGWKACCDMQAPISATCVLLLLLRMMFLLLLLLQMMPLHLASICASIIR